MIGLADGFKLGYSTVREAQEAEYRRQLQDEQMQWAREDRAEKRGKQAKIDAAMNRVRGLSTDGVVEQGAGDLSTGGIQQVMADGYGGATGAEAAQQLGVDSAREAQRGMRAPGATAQTQAAATQSLGLAQTGPKTRKAKESEILGATADAIMAYGTPESAVASVGMRDRAKSAAFDEAFNDARDQWGALPDDQRAALVAAKSKDKTFPGFGAFVHGTDTKGNPVRYMHYRTEGGKRLELDEDSVADIVALEAAMRVDPTRARAEIRKLKGDAKVAAMEMFKIGLEGAKLNNDAAYREDSLAFQRDVEQRRAGLAERELALRGREVGARIAATERANWQPEQYVDDQGNVRIYDVNRTGKTPDFRERTMPAGLKPYRPSPELKVNQDGSVQRGGMLFTPDPKKPGAFIAAQFPGESALDKALQGDKGSSMAGMRRITQADLELAAIDPGRLQRTAKRGLFGGLTYVYKDPATGKEYSADEFDAIQQAPR